jgi:hypothetical protein
MLFKIIFYEGGKLAYVKIKIKFSEYDYLFIF